MEEGENNDIQNNENRIFKIVLVGDTGVGKSCIINRFMKNEFEEGFVSTMGSVYFKKTINVAHKGSILLDIWDTAGQEKYRSITKVFYKDTQAVIVVFDITRNETFESITQFWYDEIKENAAKETKLFLVGNKTDLYEYEEGNDVDRKGFANMNGITYTRVSAKTGTNINVLFENIAMELAEKLPDVGEEDGNAEGGSRSYESSRLNLTKCSNKDRRNKKGCCK